MKSTFLQIVITIVTLIASFYLIDSFALNVEEKV